MFGFRKSLPSILAGFHRTLSHLDKLHERNRAEMEHHTNKVEAHAAAHAELNAENTRIGAVRGRIASLVGA